MQTWGHWIEQGIELQFQLLPHLSKHLSLRVRNECSRKSVMCLEGASQAIRKRGTQTTLDTGLCAMSALHVLGF